MIRQFEMAAHVAVEMLKDGQLSFDAWYEEVTQQGGFEKTPGNNLRLIWTWDSLRQDPVLKNEFQNLSPAGMHWNRNSQPFLVLERDSWFVIGLSRNGAGGLKSSRNKPPQEELAAFQLLGDLSMQPGRNDRLECCDCPCLLQLRPDQVYAKEREMDIMGVRIEQIMHLGNSLILIEVPSINQAYTVASRRLEPKRRSHVGNIYEHVLYVNGPKRCRLEDIRLAVEIGEWRLPSAPKITSEHPLFPEDI